MSDKERMRWKEICVGWYMASENTEPKYRDLNLRATLIDLLIRWEWRQSRIYRKKLLKKNAVLIWKCIILPWLDFMCEVSSSVGQFCLDFYLFDVIEYSRSINQKLVKTFFFGCFAWPNRFGQYFNQRYFRNQAPLLPSV